MMKGCTEQWLSPDAVPLASRFYADEGQKEKARRDERVAVLRNEQGRIVAALRLSPRDGHWLLRALRVASTEQGRGLARQLMRFTLREMTAPIWCYSLPHLDAFYQSLGFQPISPECAPNAISGPYQAYQRHQSLSLLCHPGPQASPVRNPDH
ncbi:GNAT family N-acetyltransferase [Marinobacter hydrocarbonoclasticus]|nr:GNAT family N-acetyltransferase [Marinobacter nauticus]